MIDEVVDEVAETEVNKMGLGSVGNVVEDEGASQQLQSAIMQSLTLVFVFFLVPLLLLGCTVSSSSF